MAFSLIEIRSGERKTFSTKDLLALIGDSINDEILLKGNTYRLSSGLEVLEADLSNLDTSISWVNHAFVVEEEGQNVFINPVSITDTNSVFLTVNNVLYTYGTEADYHIQDDRMYWHGAFDLDPQDRIQMKALMLEISTPPTPPTNPDTIAENE